MTNMTNFSSIFIANWKLNGNIEFIDEYYGKLSINSKNCVVVCSPSIFLNRLKSNNINLFSGSQDVSIYIEGAYTGEVSSKMLSNEKISFCLVGHSERRQFFNEKNETVKIKSFNLINDKIIPVICVGETLEQKEKNLTKSIITEQLEKGISENSNFQNTVIAYEPVWAIGTGLTPSLNEIEEVHSFIKEVDKKFNNYKVLYGGSVNASNSADINSLNSVDGCLVGGSSLNVDEFNKIIS